MFTRIAGRACLATTVAGVASMFGFAPVAEAAYPGPNGSIAFSSMRDNSIAIYQVGPGDPAVGPRHGHTKASELSMGSADLGPFYSPNGETVYFSSDRDKRKDWVIYSVASGTPESPTNPALELSALPGQEANNDYPPSVAPDGETVVFNRDNKSIDTLWAPTGASSVCTLYTPAEGLGSGGRHGTGSRVVFDPADPSKLIFVGGDGHLHLLSGIEFGGSNPCGQAGLTDTDLSAEAFPSTSPYAKGYDANPDWSPNGQEVVFNSTRGGGDTLFMIDLTTSVPTGHPIWPWEAGPHRAVSTEPVFSPDGQEIAFVETQRGANVLEEAVTTSGKVGWRRDLLDTMGGQRNRRDWLSMDPDWQPDPQTPAVLPESPFTAALPVGALLSCALLFGTRYLRARRRAARA